MSAGRVEIVVTLSVTIEELRSFFQEERYDREALEANIEHARSGRWFAEECETIDPADIDAANDILWLAIEMHGTTPTEAEPAQPLATITARSFGLSGWTTAIALRSCQLIRADIRAGRIPAPIPNADVDTFASTA